MLGIDTDAPGFARVKIEPHLGAMQKAGGEMPHPLGMINVQYRLEKGKWLVEIALPEGLTGRLLWKGQEIALKSGINNMVF